MLNELMIKFINEVDSNVITDSAKDACIKKGIFVRAFVIASYAFGNEEDVDTEISMLSPVNIVEHLSISGNQLDYVNNQFILKDRLFNYLY